MMENNIQYFHGTKEKYGVDKQFTIAVNVPTRENLRIEIWKLLGTNITDVNIPVGITRVSPKDQYKKSTGREISSERIENTWFKLMEVVATDQGIMVELHSSDIALQFLMLPDSDKVRLVNAYI